MELNTFTGLLSTDMSLSKELVISSPKYFTIRFLLRIFVVLSRGSFSRTNISSSQGLNTMSNLLLTFLMYSRNFLEQIRLSALPNRDIANLRWLQLAQSAYTCIAIRGSQEAMSSVGVLE